MQFLPTCQYIEDAQLWSPTSALIQRSGAQANFARAANKDPAFIKERKRRAGIEGTLSKAVRVNGLRQRRYIGSAKTQLQHLLAAAAINLGRIADWIAEKTLAPTRQSAFVRLMTAAN